MKNGEKFSWFKNLLMFVAFARETLIDWINYFALVIIIIIKIKNSHI